MSDSDKPDEVKVPEPTDKPVGFKFSPPIEVLLPIEQDIQTYFNGVMDESVNDIPITIPRRFTQHPDVFADAVRKLVECGWDVRLLLKGRLGTDKNVFRRVKYIVLSESMDIATIYQIWWEPAGNPSNTWHHELGSLSIPSIECLRWMKEKGDKEGWGCVLS
jgi:hypothetical protein